MRRCRLTTSANLVDMKVNRNVLKRRMLKRRKDWRCWCKSYWMRVGTPSVRIVKSCSLLVTTQWLTSAERTEMPKYSVWFKTELLLIHEGRVSSCWGLFWRRRQSSCHGAQNTVFLCLTELNISEKKQGVSWYHNLLAHHDVESSCQSKQFRNYLEDKSRPSADCISQFPLYMGWVGLNYEHWIISNY